MSVRIYSPRMTWQPLLNCDRCEAALREALDDWRGTPYESGQRFVQRGADCIGGVFGSIDQADGRPRATYPNMPRDASMHDRVGAVAAVRELVRRYSPCFKVLPDDSGMHFVEPGDIVVTGSPGGGPGHVQIVGTRCNELWHATPSAGFHQSGWSFLDNQTLYAIYRIEDKYRWGS